MHADSMQLIKTWLLVRCDCKIHDGVVQFCLPARQLGTSKGTQLWVWGKCNIYTTDVLVSQLQLIQTYLHVDATLTDMHAGRV